MVRRVNPLEETGWDAALLASGMRSSFFHGTAWARVLADSYGYTPAYFVTTTAAGLRGLLPLMEVRSPLTGQRGVSLPFTDECEPVCVDPETFAKLFAAAQAHGLEQRWKYLECRGGGNFLPKAIPSTSFYGHQLALLGREDQQFDRIASPVRRAIRKAQKNDVTVDLAQDLTAMEEFYQLLCLTRKRHGTPPPSFGFFAQIHRHVLASNQGFVALARHNQKTIAGAVYFHWAKRGLYKYGASDVDSQNLRANNLIMWEAIRWFLKNGFESLNFGRTSLSNNGLRRFKLGWDAKETTIDYMRYDYQMDRFVTVPDQSEGWHKRVFQMLPIPVSRLIGKALYKHVA